MVPTVRVGTNLQHTLGAHRSGARSQLVKATDLDFLQVRFLFGLACAKDVRLARSSRKMWVAVGAQDALEVPGNARLKCEKIRWILPKFGKESVDLPVFVKDSVAVLQIL